MYGTMGKVKRSQLNSGTQICPRWVPQLQSNVMPKTYMRWKIKKFPWSFYSYLRGWKDAKLLKQAQALFYYKVTIRGVAKRSQKAGRWENGRALNRDSSHKRSSLQKKMAACVGLTTVKEPVVHATVRSQKKDVQWEEARGPERLTEINPLWFISTEWITFGFFL